MIEDFLRIPWDLEKKKSRRILRDFHKFFLDCHLFFKIIDILGKSSGFLDTTKIQLKLSVSFINVLIYLFSWKEVRRKSPMRMMPPLTQAHVFT